MNRIVIDALIIGLTIGLGAIMLEAWVGDATWPIRIGALLAVGLALCGAQYLLLRKRKG